MVVMRALSVLLLQGTWSYFAIEVMLGHVTTEVTCVLFMWKLEEPGHDL